MTDEIQRNVFLLFTVCWLITGMAGALHAAGGVLFAKPFVGSNKDDLLEVYEFASPADHTGYYILNPGVAERKVHLELVITVVYDDELTAKRISPAPA